MQTEEFKPVQVASDIDLTGAAVNECASINMTNFHRATFIVNFQELGGAAIYVKVYSGAATATLTSALTFRYALGSAAYGAANSDVLAAWATSANLSIAHATYDNYMLVIEVDAKSMDLANEENWLTLVFSDTDTGATGNVSVAAILQPRYGSNQSPSALV